MPGWAELDSYSALAAFCFGTLTALSFWGMGRLLCGRWLAPMHVSLRLPAECAAGVLAMSLIVQGLAMAHTSRVGPMRTLWTAALVMAAIALAVSWYTRRSGAREQRAPGASPWLWAPAMVLGAAILLAGAAPATRSDELGYHALATARLLMDGGLRFHPLPWEASVVPQLVWHFALAPLYAVAGSAAAGVTSAWLALLLALSTARLVQWQSASAALGAAAGFIALAGSYSIVFFSTTGPHAFGYLAAFTAVAAVGYSREVRREASLPAYVLTVALGCAGALAGKVTLLPVMALISGMAALDVLGETRAVRTRWALFVCLVGIPALALAPLVAWTWIAAGSPLGVLTARLVHAVTFDPQTLAAYLGTRQLFAERFQWRFEAAYWSLPMVLCVLAALLLEPSRERRLRWWLIAGCQALVILLLLPKELRHLGGIQYPLMASGLVALGARWQTHGRSDRALALWSMSAAAPWALLSLWIATIYLPVASGRESAQQFVRRYAGLQADYEALDRQLPADARILIGRSRSDPLQYGWYARPPVYYAPRPVLFDTAEVGPAGHVYLLYIGAGADGVHGPIPLDPWLPPGHTLGRRVYSDANARFYPSRTPAAGAGLARLDVFELGEPPAAPAVANLSHSAAMISAQ